MENSIYVDDTLFGSDDITELREMRDQLINCFTEGKGIPIAEVGREFADPFGRYSQQSS